MPFLLAALLQLTAFFFLPPAWPECLARQVVPAELLAAGPGNCRPDRGPQGDRIPITGAGQTQTLSLVYLPSVRMSPFAQEELAEITPGPGADFHVVRAGESLAKIARQYGAPLDVLALANPHIANPALIHVDDRLWIPMPE
jgi:hypothetical protein